MLYKRHGSPYWQIKFRLRGIKVNESAGTPDRKKAEAKEQKLREDIWDGEHGVLSKTWEEGIEQWKVRKSAKRSLRRDLEIYAAAGHMFAGQRLDEITDEKIAEYGVEVAQATTLSNANRHLAQLRAFFNAMISWKLRNLPVKVELMDAPEYEPPVVLTKERLDALIQNLPPHLVSLSVFLAETGVRLGVALNLRWDPPISGERGSWVDLEQGTLTCPSSSQKSKKPITIPLSSVALELLNGLERSPTGYVFVDHKGHAPMTTIKTAWATATTKAGLVGLRRHDLRHAWATWHAQGGTPSLILQKLGNWSSPKMLRRYTHLEVADLRQYVK